MPVIAQDGRQVGVVVVGVLMDDIKNFGETSQRCAIAIDWGMMRIEQLVWSFYVIL